MVFSIVTLAIYLFDRLFVCLFLHLPFIDYSLKARD